MNDIKINFGFMLHKSKVNRIMVLLDILNIISLGQIPKKCFILRIRELYIYNHYSYNYKKKEFRFICFIYNYSR